MNLRDYEVVTHVDGDVEVVCHRCQKCVASTWSAACGQDSVTHLKGDLTLSALLTAASQHAMTHPRPALTP